MGEMAHITVELEEGERIVRRVEEVRFELGPMIGRGLLLLTNRRLICSGRYEKASKMKITKEKIPFFFEWSLGDLVVCSIKKKTSLFGKKELFLAFTQVVEKIFTDEKVKVNVHKFTHVEVQFPDGKVQNAGVCVFTDIDQPEVLKSEIMRQFEVYKRAPPPKVEK